LLCLDLNADKLYRLGIGKAVYKSTLSRANESRDWRIFQDFGFKLIEQKYVSLSPFEKTPITKIFLNNELQEIKEQNRIQLKIIL
jgi:hypothetical protein